MERLKNKDYNCCPVKSLPGGRLLCVANDKILLSIHNEINKRIASWCHFESRYSG